jgi:hypothetical protein
LREACGGQQPAFHVLRFISQLPHAGRSLLLPRGIGSCLVSPRSHSFIIQLPVLAAAEKQQLLPVVAPCLSQRNMSCTTGLPWQARAIPWTESILSRSGSTLVFSLRHRLAAISRVHALGSFYTSGETPRMVQQIRDHHPLSPTHPLHDSTAYPFHPPVRMSGTEPQRATPAKRQASQATNPKQRS